MSVLISNMTPMGTSSPNVPEWSIADRLHKIRKDRHLTQEQMAASLGVKLSTWAAWESGRNRPGDVLDLAVSIERRYGVPAAWTLGVLQPFDRRRNDPGLPTQQNRRRWTDIGSPQMCTP